MKAPGKEGLSVNNLCFDVVGQRLLSAVDLDAPHAKLTALVGPNGAGKSTTLSVVAGLQVATCGSANFAGADLLDMARKHRAQRVAIVEQECVVTIDLKVFDVVALGRFPLRQGLLERFLASDRKAILSALQRLEILHLADRNYVELSGGEKRLVQIARALAQEPKLLLLDEPVNHLDLSAQLRVLDTLRSLCRSGMTVLVVMHNINQAVAYADRIAVLIQGRIILECPASQLSEAVIQDVYGISAARLENPMTKSHLFAYSQYDHRAKKTERLSVPTP
ncbi:ABC transporter ATP-binding protein [Labrenzia sp. DG1229]|uniref:ABC transporter ATP-binding protein n=1 Tax=Labrenzia sp. DG1229 TaxID=681847 RepID=UPI00068ABC8F|nr:ABC transporter ATP-binding protein [Labrenzia sp. DG1229]